MYIPEAFAISEQAAFEIVGSNPFGILITVVDQTPLATHIPFLREGKSLIGHVAKANPHSRHLNSKSLAIFRGPHTYISPRWYGSAADVPTWNYQAVHISGICRPILDMAERRAVIDRLVQRYEAGAWAVDWQQDRYARQLDAITAFELRIESIFAKSKLSQNKTAEDINSVIAGLRATGNPSDADVAKLMQGKA